jgi:putative membrane protein
MVPPSLRRALRGAGHHDEGEHVGDAEGCIPRTRTPLTYALVVVRFLVRTAILLGANAIGLIVAAVVLEGFHLGASGFIIAIALFTVSLVLLQPFLVSQLRRRGSSMLGGVALLATLAALIITDIVSSGLSIHGLTAWIAGAVIVWATSLLAAFILPYLGLRKYLETRDST